MPRLVLTFNDQVIKEYPFLKESVTVGRNSDNTIVIDNLAVSGYHARIDKTGSDYILTDLQSTNGTFVKDKKVVTHKLTHGDDIIIGKHAILFVATEQSEDVEDEKKQLDLDKTMMLDTAKQRELLSKQKIEVVPPKRPKKLGVAV